MSTVDPATDSRPDAAPFQLLPPLAEHEYAALKADIADRGVVPVVQVGHPAVETRQAMREVSTALQAMCIDAPGRLLTLSGQPCSTGSRETLRGAP